MAVADKPLGHGVSSSARRSERRFVILTLPPVRFLTGSLGQGLPQSYPPFCQNGGDRPARLSPRRQVVRPLTSRESCRAKGRGFCECPGGRGRAISRSVRRLRRGLRTTPRRRGVSGGPITGTPSGPVSPAEGPFRAGPMLMARTGAALCRRHWPATLLRVESPCSSAGKSRLHPGRRNGLATACPDSSNARSAWWHPTRQALLLTCVARLLAYCHNASSRS